MSNFTNAAPQLILEGIKDSSTDTPVRDPEQTPTHFPHFFFFAASGPDYPLAVGANASNVYGSKTFDPRYGYYNHQTELLTRVTGKGNSFMGHRLIPNDAGPKSRLLLSLDIVADDIQQYRRNTDGTFEIGTDGAKIPITGSAGKIAGHRAKWVINDWTVGSDVDPFGEVSTKAGSIMSATDVQSTLMPIMEVEANFFGSDGNNLGLRVTAPTTESGIPMDENLFTAIKAYVYRLSVVKRLDASSTVNVVETESSMQSLDFSFAEGAINPVADESVSLDEIFIDSYQDIDSPGLIPKFGPFGRIKIYQENLEEILTMIGSLEAPLGLLPELTMDATSEYLHTVNIISGVNQHNVPYYSFELEGPANGGIRLTENTAVWAEGGSDGTMTFETFDALVKNQMENYGSLGADLLDDARYPFSFYYDSGFTLETKLSLLQPLAHRKDVFIVLGTQDASAPLNTPAQDSSICATLKNAARLFPESEIHGTAACRAAVIAHAGQMIGSKYRGPNGYKHLPFTHIFAEKNADYMGAASGIWKSSAAFDESPNNQLTGVKHHNVVFKKANTRTKDWAAGMVWAQSFDMRSLFWPGIQTVYDDDTSILNSYFNAVIAVDLEKVAQRAWRELAGSSGKLTKGQFIQKSNNLITERVEGKYDGRVTVRAETYFTKADEKRGYSWRTIIHMYGENMRTVGTCTIEAHRSIELELAAE